MAQGDRQRGRSNNQRGGGRNSQVASQRSGQAPHVLAIPKRGGVAQKSTPRDGSRSGGRVQQGRGQQGRSNRGGRGGRGSASKPKTKEELDAEMNSYFLKDAKFGAKKLDADMDDYWSKRQEEPAAEAAEAPTEAAAPAAEEAAAGEAA